mgnify:FL=1
MSRIYVCILLLTLIKAPIYTNAIIVTAFYHLYVLQVIYSNYSPSSMLLALISYTFDLHVGHQLPTGPSAPGLPPAAAGPGRPISPYEVTMVCVSDSVMVHDEVKTLGDLQVHHLLHFLQQVQPIHQSF